MSHVDDGELTAYADGAYPINDPEALRISAHLSTCDNCRTRLEQSQELRTRASEILSYAAPRNMEVPPFEALETQIATSSKKPPAFPFAWAATVVMALGLGWFGRGFQQQGMQEIAQRNAMPASVADEAPPVSTQVSPEAGIAAVEERAESKQARMMPPPRPVEAEPTVGGIAGELSSISAERRGFAADAVAETPPPNIAEADFSGQAVEVITAAEAERRNLVIGRIPELPIVRVVLTDRHAVVEQSLPDGKIIRIREQPVAPSAPPPPAAPAVAQSAGAEARKATRQSESVAAAAPQAANQPRASVFVVTGDLPQDSLRKLTGKVR
jgi:hypothetical protein